MRVLDCNFDGSWGSFRQKAVVDATEKGEILSEDGPLTPWLVVGIS